MKRAGIVSAVRFEQGSFGIFVETGAAAEVLTINVSEGVDMFVGSGTDLDPFEKLINALNTNTGGGTWAGTIDEDGRATITCSVYGRIAWGSISTEIDPALFGFLAQDYDTIGGIVSDFTCSTWWIPDTAIYRHNLGESDQRGAVHVNETDGSPDGYSLGEAKARHRCAWRFVSQERTRDRFASADPTNCLEHQFNTYWARMRTFRIYESTVPLDRLLLPNYECKIATHKIPWELDESSRAVRYNVVVEGIEV